MLLRLSFPLHRLACIHSLYRPIQSKSSSDSKAGSTPPPPKKPCPEHNPADATSATTTSQESSSVKPSESSSSSLTDLSKPTRQGTTTLPDAIVETTRGSSVISGHFQPIKQLFTLKQLIDKSIPILDHRHSHPLASRLRQSDPSPCPYPIHPATLDCLELSIKSLLQNDVHLPPSVKSRILSLSCPIKGSEVYLGHVIHHVAQKMNAHFLSMSNDDVFARVSNHLVMDAHPLKTPLQGTLMKDRSLGRRKGLSSMIALHVAEQEDADADDIPNVPFPWYRSYTHQGKPQSIILPKATSTEQELMVHAFTRFFKSVQEEARGKRVLVFYQDFLNLMDSFNEKQVLGALTQAFKPHEFTHILLVIPCTPTFATLTTPPPNKHPLYIIRAVSSTDKEDRESVSEDIPEPSTSKKKKKGLDFDSVLDAFIGISSIKVFPPLHLSDTEIKQFQERLNQDYKKMVLSFNLNELKLAAKSARVLLPENLVQPMALLEAEKPACGIPSIEEYGLSSCLAEEFLTPAQAERIIMMAMGSTDLSQVKTPQLANIKLSRVVLTPEALLKAMSVYSESVKTHHVAAAGIQYAGVFRANPRDVLTLDKHEEKLLKMCLVRPSALSSGSFSSIGGLDHTKRIIDELIRLPLQCPELFQSGILKSSTTGILLFGPPGTGKTLLARAVAAESGTNFLNVQMSHLQSMWVGENEKNVKALFSLARKLKPCVIFVDEIDALLKIRQRYQPSWMTNTINEFMQEWDGIQSKNDRVIVVGATNRPFDLDEAVLRRLPRRILIDLPSIQDREAILNVLLKDEVLVSQTVSEKDRHALIQTIAEKTDRFSGSDLKNLCIAAALNAVREQILPHLPLSSPPLRILNLSHFMQALESGDVVPSLSDRAELMKELKEWNKKYGTGSGGYGKSTSEWGFQ